MIRERFGRSIRWAVMAKGEVHHRPIPEAALCPNCHGSIEHGSKAICIPRLGRVSALPSPNDQWLWRNRKNIFRTWLRDVVPKHPIVGAQRRARRSPRLLRHVIEVAHHDAAFHCLSWVSRPRIRSL